MKMHKSHLNERKQESNGSQNSSEEQQLMEGKYQNQTSHGKNGISHSHIRKYNQFISFGRIMPKQINHDKEHLYEDNIKLKEKIKFLEDQNLKLKTRVNIAEKEANQILSYYTGHGEFGPTNENRPGSKSVARNLKNSKQTLQRKNVAKKMIRQAQDEVTVLKKENERIKRSVKYTQITELQVENSRLLEQTGRLEQYIRELIQNQNYEEYEAQILQLRQKLQLEKDHVKGVTHQMKKKNQQCEELKEKLKQSQIQKISHEKKLSRDISILRGEIQKIKGEKDLTHSTKGKGQRNSSIGQCKKCHEHQKQLVKFQSTLKAKDQEIQRLHSKLSQKDKQIASLNQYIKKENSKIKKEKESDKKKEDTPKKKLQNKSEVKEKSMERSKQKSLEKSRQKKQTIKDEQQDYAEQFEGGEVLELDSDKNDKKMENYEEDYEYDEDFGEESKIKQQPNKSNTKKEEVKEEEEEVLFQKPKKKKEKKDKKDKKDKAKVDQALKETITYKLMAQRYTYEDFEKDIHNSGVDEFSVEELATMLNNQPFYLVDQYLEDVLVFCFGKADIEMEDALDTAIFLKKMRQLVNDIDMISEEEEAGLLREVAAEIMKGSKKLEKAFKKVEDNSGTVSKKDFTEILKNTGKMGDNKIQLCLGEACLISMDINHINYSDFLKRFNEDEPL